MLRDCHSYSLAEGGQRVDVFAHVQELQVVTGPSVSTWVWALYLIRSGAPEGSKRQWHREAPECTSVQKL